MRTSCAVDVLLDESAEQLQRAAGNPERIVTAIKLFLTRAFGAGLSTDLVRDLLGILPGCLLDRAALSSYDESLVVEAYSLLEESLAVRYGVF